MTDVESQYLEITENRRNSVKSAFTILGLL